MNWLVLGGIAAVSLLIVLGSIPMESDLRRLVRAGVHSAASASAFSMVGVLLLRHATLKRGLGMRLLAIGVLAYAAAQFAYLCIFLYDILYDTTLPIAEYAGLFNSLVQVVMSLGVLIWLMDDERARAEETAAALAESQSRFRRLVEEVRLIAWEYDPDGRRFTFVSPQAETILGYPLTQWREPEFWFNHVHPDDREHARAFSHERSLLGVDHEFEYRMIRRDGGTVWFRDLTSVIRRQGECRSLHGVLIDITEVKAAEEQLAVSEERYRNLVLSSTDAIIVNQGGRIAFCNPTAARMLGYADVTSLIGRDTMEIVAPSSRDLVRERIDASPRRTPCCRRSRSDGCDSDGSEMEVEVGAKAIVFEGRAAIQVQGRDITRRKNAERTVADIAHRLKAVVDSAPLVLWATDRDLNITVSEGRGLESLGLRPGQTVGMNITDLYGSIPGVIKNHQRALAGEVVVDVVEVQGVIFESRHAPVTSADGGVGGVIGVAIDITQRMRAEKALRESESRLRGIFEATIDPLWDWDVASNRATYSPSWARLLEYCANG